MGRRKTDLQERKDWYYSDIVQSFLSNSSERLILYTLVTEYCNNDTWEVCPSQKTLREKAKLSKPTVIKVMKGLVQNQLLIPVSDDKKLNNYNSKTYRVNIAKYGLGQEVKTISKLPEKKDLNQYLGGKGSLPKG